MTRQRRTANFDFVARPYRWMEYLIFGRMLERCRERFLPEVAACCNALVFGDGDGRFLARLLTANPKLHADAVDDSAAMLQLLVARASDAAPNGAHRIVTHHMDALNFAPARQYDLIVTHFFLDCLQQSQVNALAKRLGRNARPGTQWLISDFRIPQGSMRWPSHIIVRLLYLAFRMLTGLRTTALPDHALALNPAGFRRIRQNLSLGGLLTSELWEYTPAMLPPQKPKNSYPIDPVPDPEPASPSLPAPDPGVFHHEPDDKKYVPKDVT